jgi:hypothetical protein
VTGSVVLVVAGSVVSVVVTPPGQAASTSGAVVVESDGIVEFHVLSDCARACDLGDSTVNVARHRNNATAMRKPTRSTHAALGFDGLLETTFFTQPPGVAQHGGRVSSGAHTLIG